VTDSGGETASATITAFGYYQTLVRLDPSAPSSSVLPDQSVVIPLAVVAECTGQSVPDCSDGSVPLSYQLGGSVWLGAGTGSTHGTIPAAATGQTLATLQFPGNGTWPVFFGATGWNYSGVAEINITVGSGPAPTGAGSGNPLVVLGLGLAVGIAGAVAVAVIESRRRSRASASTPSPRPGDGGAPPGA